MPAPTEKARRFFGAELARKRAGKKTRTGLSEAKLREMASKPTGEKKKAGNPIDVTTVTMPAKGKSQTVGSPKLIKRR